MWYRKKIIMPEALEVMGCRIWWAALGDVIHVDDVAKLMEYMSIDEENTDVFFQGPYATTEEARKGKHNDDKQ